MEDNPVYFWLILILWTSCPLWQASHLMSQAAYADSQDDRPVHDHITFHVWIRLKRRAVSEKRASTLRARCLRCLHQFKDLAVMWSRLQLVQVAGVSRLIRGFLMEESCCSIGPWHETIERPVHCWPVQQRDLSCVLQGIVSHCAGFRQQLPDKGIVRSVWANGTLIRSAENKDLIFRACVFWALAASWNLH